MIPSLFAASHIVDAVFPKGTESSPAEPVPQVGARTERARAFRPFLPVGALLRSFRRPVQAGS